MKRALLTLITLSLLAGCYAQPQPVVIQVPAKTRIDEQGNTITEPPNVTVIMPAPPAPTYTYTIMPCAWSAWGCSPWGWRQPLAPSPWLWRQQQWWWGVP